MPSSDAQIQAYSEALLSLAGAAGIQDSVEQELGAAVDLFGSNGALRRFVTDPHVEVRGRSRGLDELLEDKVHPVLRHFLLTLLEAGVLHELGGIAAACHSEMAERQQRASGELVTAAPITPERVARIEEETGRILGKDVQLRVRVNPQLIGGLVVHVGDFVLDGSIGHQLESIRKALLSDTTRRDDLPSQ